MKTVDINKHQIHVFAVTERNILTAKMVNKVLHRKKKKKKKKRRKSTHKDINFLPVALLDELS